MAVYTKGDPRYWIGNDVLSKVLDECAFMPYQVKSDPTDYKGIEELAQEFMAYNRSVGNQETGNGYSVSKKGYTFTLVVYGDEPICIVVDTPYYSTRVNLYSATSHYTIEVEEPIKASNRIMDVVKGLIMV